LHAQRLPDLNLPRAGYSVFCINGEITVVGGHTDGFVPTATAEYYKDGAWHLLSTAYEHDNGFAVVLSSGKALIAGGHEKHLGIGQTFVAEMYDPTTHSFEGFGCLDTKRSLASAIEMDSGHVVIAGNHYADDAIECFDGQKNFTYIKDVAAGRCRPYILRIANNDALVFGAFDTKDKPLPEPSLIDRIKGEPFREPLLDTWHPLGFEGLDPNAISFIGDEQAGDYRHLLAASNDEGQMAILQVCDTIFSILPTDVSIPLESPWGKIKYYSPLIVDRMEQKGYILGVDNDRRFYALCVNYSAVSDGSPASLTLYYTDPLTDAGTASPILTPEGNILLAGGITDSNFYPYRTVFLLPVGRQVEEVFTHGALKPYDVAGYVCLLIFVLLFLNWLRVRRKKEPVVSRNELTSEPDVTNILKRTRQLMEEKQLYLNSDLKLPDVASLLDISPRKLAEYIKDHEDCSFAQFINEYRIEHAKRLLQEQPEKKLTQVAIESGFANETSFFRTFKSITGTTPREWLAQK
jgi:AraC-like DNA-binding protein